MSEIGDRICTPLINNPISLNGVSCSDGTTKFWLKGNFLNILSGSNERLACFFKINLWVSEVVVPIPTCTVDAVPIWEMDSYNFIFVILELELGITGSM